jgi:deoxyadenosine/deoxycytidine kinase
MEIDVIGIVGPCAAGKSTLTGNLKAHGYHTKHIAQEHSYVQDMWLRFEHPDKLIYLDVSYSVSKMRRNLNWTFDEYRKQIHRLGHARAHADYYLKTDTLTTDEVLHLVLEFLE